MSTGHVVHQVQKNWPHPSQNGSISCQLPTFQVFLLNYEMWSLLTNALKIKSSWWNLDIYTRICHRLHRELQNIRNKLIGSAIACYCLCVTYGSHSHPKCPFWVAFIEANATPFPSKQPTTVPWMDRNRSTLVSPLKTFRKTHRLPPPTPEIGPYKNKAFWGANMFGDVTRFCKTCDLTKTYQNPEAEQTCVFFVSLCILSLSKLDRCTKPWVTIDKLLQTNLATSSQIEVCNFAPIPTQQTVTKALRHMYISSGQMVWSKISTPSHDTLTWWC